MWQCCATPREAALVNSFALPWERLFLIWYKLVRILSSLCWTQAVVLLSQLGVFCVPKENILQGSSASMS